MHLPSKYLLSGLMAAFMFSCTQPSTSKTEIINETENYHPGPIPSFSFVSLEEAPNGIAPLMDETKIQLILAGYFDIQSTSTAGREVMGRINYRNNFKFASEGIPQDLSFHLTQGGHVFELKNQRDQYGRLFGKLILKDPSKLNSSSFIPLKIELRQNSKILESCQAKVNIVPETLWSQHFAKVKAFVLSEDRLSTRYKLRLKKQQFNQVFEDLEKNKGRFSDFSFYDLTSDELRTKVFPKQKEYSKQLVDSAERIAGLALHLSSQEKSALRKKRSRLLAQAIQEYTLAFPLDNLHDTQSLAHNDRTHQWRFGDPLMGASILILEDLLEDLRSDPKIQEYFQTMNHFHLMSSMSTTDNYRDHTKTRYFLQGDNLLPICSGLWADANRHHRMRTWIGQTALLMDYNQPITSLEPWYFAYGEWGKQGTNLLPEWEPKGCFADLKVWADTNSRLAANFHQSGLKPDGSISHHTGSRQDMAHLAYGLEWQTKGLSDVALILKNTPFEVSSEPFNMAVDFLSYAYPIMMYKGSMDYQTVGRSHYGANLGNFTQEVFIPGVEELLESQNPTKAVKNTEILEHFVEQQKSQSQEIYDGNYAFWVNDYMVHRNAGEKAYFMSVKMQSSRTKGAEGFKGSGDYGFHNGSGVFQIKQDGQEYHKARYSMDWHAMPGITEEWRTDELPLSSKKKAYSEENFCGTVSDTKNGLASFLYSRTDPYSSSSAFKSYFMLKDYAVFLGSNIKRTKAGQGKSIITTLDQVEWDKALTYSINGEEKSLEPGSPLDLQASTQEICWVHQDNVAYIILPGEKTKKIILKSQHQQNSLPKQIKERVPVFMLAIDHGSQPQDEDYSYIIVPNIKLNEIPAKIAQLSQSHQLTSPSFHAHSDATTTQAAFTQAASLKINQWELSVDKPALVQITQRSNMLGISLTDPMHDLGTKSISLHINKKLKPGTYHYKTQGMEFTNVEGQIVEISSKENGSTLKFHLADLSDQKAYAHRGALYAGMPAHIQVKLAE